MNQPEKSKFKAERESEGLIFSIQSHSVHDGPGTRTTVFLNGCPLKCLWCSNPEGLHVKPVLMHSSVKCKKCGKCIQACTKEAVKVGNDLTLEFDRSVCDKCITFECVEVCLNEGNSMSGEYYTVEKLMEKFQRDRHFWGDRGGVTFSGGEPLLQKDFILNLLKRCSDSYIHTCIETTACVAPEYWMEVIKNVDWIFADIKHFDSQKHKEFCGVGNELILKNLKTLGEADWWDGFIVVRIPIVPGYNDDEDNIRKTAQFVKKIGFEVINILPFHRLGESKYRQLGRVYKCSEMLSPSADHMNKVKTLIESEGLICFVGHETPF